jgi:hypothetical protein
MPGTGKSTLVDLLINSLSYTGQTVSLHRVDDLHTDEGGRFQWDETLAESRYETNLRNFSMSCDQGFDIVISDCINMTCKDVEQYKNIAEKHNYQVYVVATPLVSADVSADRSLHDVDPDRAQEILDMWEHWPPAEYVKKLKN